MNHNPFIRSTTTNQSAPNVKYFRKTTRGEPPLDLSGYSLITRLGEIAWLVFLGLPSNLKTVGDFFCRSSTIMSPLPNISKCGSHFLNICKGDLDLSNMTDLVSCGDFFCCRSTIKALPLNLKIVGEFFCRKAAIMCPLPGISSCGPLFLNECKGELELANMTDLVSVGNKFCGRSTIKAFPPNLKIVGEYFCCDATIMCPLPNISACGRSFLNNCDGELDLSNMTDFKKFGNDFCTGSKIGKYPPNLKRIGNRIPIKPEN